MPDPLRWSYQEIVELAGEAIERFRSDRANEPRVYAEFFDVFVPIFRDLIDRALPSLSETLVDVDRELLAEIVSDEDARTAFRYLAAPPISDDDLRTLAASRLSPAALRTDADQAERVRNAVLNVIDPFRFPWIEAGRSPTTQEREIAVVSSAVLVATQKVGTRRRNDAKKQQEDRVKNLLRSIGFTEVRPRTIALLEDGPRPGEFCGEASSGTHALIWLLGCPTVVILRSSARFPIVP